MKALEREPDERLLIEAAQSEPARFAELYEQNFPRVYAFLARRVSTREEAQDLTSEVFHRAMGSIRNFKWQGAPFVAWLYGIAANVLSGHWEKLGINPATEQSANGEEEMDLSGAGCEIERSVMLAELVDLLPPDQRHVILQRFVKQKRIHEIAHEMGRSEGAIKQLQLRALENLRQKLERPI